MTAKTVNIANLQSESGGAFAKKAVVYAKEGGRLCKATGRMAELEPDGPQVQQ
jgi:hypothetical protein